MGARFHTARATQARDRSILDSLVLPMFAEYELRAVTTADVQAWVSGLVEAGYASETVRKAHNILQSILNAAVDSDLISRSPVRGIVLPRIERDEMRILSREEFGRLAGELEGVGYSVLATTAACSGLRFGELAGLHRTDVDALRRRITVRRSLSEVRGVVREEDPKSKASRRTVAVPGWLVDRLALMLGGDPRGYVFGAPRGGPLRRGNFRYRVWLPAVDRAGLRGLRFHALRHTHVGWLIEAGEHPKVIQSRLGHASIRTTLDVYGHLMAGLDEAAAEALPAPPAPSARPVVVSLPRNPR